MNKDFTHYRHWLDTHWLKLIIELYKRFNLGGKWCASVEINCWIIQEVHPRGEWVWFYQIQTIAYILRLLSKFHICLMYFIFFMFVQLDLLQRSILLIDCNITSLYEIWPYRGLVLLNLENLAWDIAKDIVSGKD